MDIYLQVAGLGFLLLVIQLVMSLTGIDDLLDFDFDADDIADLSLRTIAAFLTAFGLGGHALFVNTNQHALAVVGGLVSGVIAFKLVVYLFKLVTKLSADGTLDYKKAIGQVGSVYLTVSFDEAGEIQVPIGNRLVNAKALPKNAEVFNVGTQVKVVDVVNNNVLIVDKV